MSKRSHQGTPLDHCGASTNVITHFFRKPGTGQHSIEQVFEEVTVVIGAVYRLRVETCPRQTRSLFDVFTNIFWAYRVRGSYNHIIGDVHYLLFGLFGTKTIITVLDSSWLHNSKGVKRLLMGVLYGRVALRLADVIVCISDFTMRELVDRLKLPQDKLRMIGCSVSPLYAPIPRFSKETFVLLQVGTAHNKNLNTVVSAVSGLTCKMLIVGTLSDSQQTVLKSAKIDFVNYVNCSQQQVVELYGICDCVMFASTYEGFGLPVVEGQAVGRPVITSFIEPMVSVSGGAALFIDPMNPASIRQAVVSLMEDQELYADLVHRGYTNAKKYSREEIGQQYIDLYEQLSRQSRT